MTVIRQDDFIDSVADALQFISYYHPLDYIQAVHRAYEIGPWVKAAGGDIKVSAPRDTVPSARTRALSPYS